jgi:hypothetical protein
VQDTKFYRFTEIPLEGVMILNDLVSTADLFDLCKRELGSLVAQLLEAAKKRFFLGHGNG